MIGLRIGGIKRCKPNPGSLAAHQVSLNNHHVLSECVPDATFVLQFRKFLGMNMYIGI